MIRHMIRLVATAVITALVAIPLASAAAPAPASSPATTASTKVAADPDPEPDAPAGYINVPRKAAPPCIDPIGRGQDVCVWDGRHREGGRSGTIINMYGVTVYHWTGHRQAHRMVKQWREDCRKLKRAGKTCDRYTEWSSY